MVLKINNTLPCTPTSKPINHPRKTTELPLDSTTTETEPMQTKVQDIMVHPSSSNYLAYAGLATVGAGIGATAGYGYKLVGPPFEEISLKDGWIRSSSTDTKTAEELKHHLAFDTVLSTGELARWNANLGGVPRLVIKEEDKNRLTALDIIKQNVLQDNVYTKQGTDYKLSQNEGGIVVIPDPKSNTLKDHYLYIDLNTNEALVGNQFEATHQGTHIKSTTAITPKEVKKGWEKALVNTWQALTKQHDNIETIYTELKKAGYEILTSNSSKDLPLPQEWLAHGSWESVVKAAVKHPEDAWKLIPQEGMAKFVGGGTAIGLAVVGAGIGAYEALKPKPTQPQ